MNKQREKTEQGTERRAEKNKSMDKIESREEHRKEKKEKIITDFLIIEWRNIEKEEKEKLSDI